MKYEEWKEYALSEFIDFNPREKLDKGQQAKKIAMEKLAPFQKKVEAYELSEFNGGSKFRNGDTVMARITPCLENGKTAKISILGENEVGFGSTEFVVLREKKKLSDQDFIYYLSISPAFREIAIQSMIGSSGRQRVQQSVLDNSVFLLPPLPEQKAIADTLTCLDDKIELNNRMNNTLEEMAQAIFKSWFLDFKPFQGGEFVNSELGPIPKGWRVGTLGEICQYSKKRVAVSELSPTNYFSTENMLPNKAGVVSTSTLPSVAHTTSCKRGDVLISNIRPYFKKIHLCNEDGGCSTDVLCFSAKQLCSVPFLYSVLFTDSFFAYMVGGSKGTKMPRGDKQQIMKYPIIIPTKEVIENFNSAVHPILRMGALVKGENMKLKGVRDSLLPQLMSGDIRVPMEVR